MQTFSLELSFITGLTELKLGKGANLVAIRFLFKENWSVTEKKAPLGEKYLHFKKDGNLVAVDNKTGEVHAFYFIINTFISNAELKILRT